MLLTFMGANTAAKTNKGVPRAKRNTEKRDRACTCTMSNERLMMLIIIHNYFSAEAKFDHQASERSHVC